ncbi:hypothetical protein RJ640_024380 [Escallonia rubra]|uniref:Fungal lipase-type domain-containing protein n=1 Tax=Escallonia rubra TaxID=112253 RepID=A0AA88QZ81_9ASTE|nr:hypothetical protein RJ640_024380 [Escallonia rubra]
MFDGGYVHHGLLKSAIWLLNQESNTLKRLWVENGLDYKMVFAGHSLGSGVAALLTVIVVNHQSPRATHSTDVKWSIHYNVENEIVGIGIALRQQPDNSLPWQITI